MTSCREPGPREGSRLRPLAEAAPPPELLTEQSELALLPTLEANRLASGWRPLGNRGRLRLEPVASRSRAELVNLSSAARHLRLNLRPPGEGQVSLVAAGQTLGPFVLAPDLDLPLPEGLPVGRVSLDFDWRLADGAQRPAVASAAVVPALAAGRLEHQGTAWVLTGHALARFVVAVQDAVALHATFDPPDAALSGQEFLLSVRDQSGRMLGRRSWSERGLSGWRSGPRVLRLPLEGASGFVEVLFEARGAGPPARWQDVIIEDRPRPQPTPAKLAPPRLILVYVLDALRADHVSHLGGRPGVTPTIDRLANEGASLRRHRSVAPNTLPSTRALFTGCVGLANGSAKLSRESPPTLAELLRRAGYSTALFSANPYVGPAFGLDRGFDTVAADLGVGGEELVSATNELGRAAAVHDAALAWLKNLGSKERAFVYIHTLFPHAPYQPEEPYRTRFVPANGSTIDGSNQTLRAIRFGRREVAAADRERLQGLYTASLAYNDAELGRFLAALSTLVADSDVVLAVTADHGEEFFDHGGVMHTLTLYDELLRIPLVLWGPGRIPHTSVEAVTDSLDLRHTLLDLAGVADSASESGVSLLPVLFAGHHEKLVSHAAAATVKGGIFAASSARWKLVYAPRVATAWGMGGTGSCQHDAECLFDLAADPGEKVNRVGSGDLEAAYLHLSLKAWVERGRQREAGVEAVEPALDAETEGSLRALGYLQ